MCKEVRFKEAERILLNNGFKLSRIKGSHHYYVDANGERKVTINLKLNRMVWQRLCKENNLED